MKTQVQTHLNTPFSHWLRTRTANELITTASIKPSLVFGVTDTSQAPKCCQAEKRLWCEKQERSRREQDLNLRGNHLFYWCFENQFLHWFQDSLFTKTYKCQSQTALPRILCDPNLDEATLIFRNNTSPAAKATDISLSSNYVPFNYSHKTPRGRYVLTMSFCFSLLLLSQVLITFLIAPYQLILFRWIQKIQLMQAASCRWEFSCIQLYITVKM